MGLFADFTDDSKAYVKSIFANPQDSELYPNQGVVEETDARYIAFLASLKPTNLELARVECDRLLAIAALRIAPLQDARDLGDSTSSEEAELLSWKRYRVELGRIETQPGYPDSITWPNPPSA